MLTQLPQAFSTCRLGICCRGRFAELLLQESPFLEHRLAFFCRSKTKALLVNSWTRSRSSVRSSLLGETNPFGCLDEACRRIWAGSLLVRDLAVTLIACVRPFGTNKAAMTREYRRLQQEQARERSSQRARQTGSLGVYKHAKKKRKR